ncbi:hypothetical protein EDC04DRAFT_2601119 [Pisolithus marmoratus]|nr:hypothetical protein EDC04DRAFT_2601119 [Pisolithus marmoratus]
MPLLHCCENSRQYSTRDFPRIARTPESTAAIVACDLYHIPSQSSCYHEFLLVHVHTGPTGERLMLIIERVPRNRGTRVISSDGGVARDTITVVQARITLAAMARAFPSCSREGATSFSGGWFSFFGSYKLSQVQLLVDLHTNYCRDLYPPVDRLAPVVPVAELSFQIDMVTSQPMEYLDPAGIWNHIGWLTTTTARGDFQEAKLAR